MSKPIAVLISDVHYNVHTLALADAAMNQAIYMANELDIPLIIAGDLHDTKANLRGECMNAMIKTFYECIIPPYVLAGNHDRINEKNTEHVLDFLAPYAVIVDKPMDIPLTGCHGIPYHHDPEELRAYLKTLPDGATLIMHQGLESSNSGDYIQDKSALRHEDVSRFRVISGHYHTRQDIKTGRPQKGAVGMFSYIGNPYTLGFGEAADPRKGFQILYDDGMLKHVPTKLRRHIILKVEFVNKNYQITGKVPLEDIRSEDLVWVKVVGTKEQLFKMNRLKVSKILELDNFRLDLIPTDTTTELTGNSRQLNKGELLDNLIDSLSSTSDERKARLKELWRNSTCG